MKTRTLLVALLCLAFSANSQTTLKIMSYNALNYPGNDRTRDGYVKTVVQYANPDIVVVQEMTSAAGVSMYLANILNAAGVGTYTAGTFIDGSTDTENAIFYKANRITFIANTRIPTELRDINEFKFYHAASAETLRVYSLHLKASTGSSNEAQRAREVGCLRTWTNGLPAGANFMVTGDFNLYGSTEAAYQALIADQAGNDGHFVDTEPLSGTWNAAGYARYHTQSTRTATYSDGGSTGGLDDRFDLMLFSRAMIEAGGIAYQTGSLTPIGNDGAHFNMAVGTMPNSAADATLAYALEHASDHLPVTSILVFNDAQLPVQIANLLATPGTNGNDVTVHWSTLSETENFGFYVQVRRDGETTYQTVTNSFIAGQGTSVEPHEYGFVDAGRGPGRWWYRLQQVDLDGTTHLSAEVSAEILTSVAETAPTAFALDQNYPNPFNAGTVIRFALPAASNVTLTVYDLLGHEVTTLQDGPMVAGAHQVSWDGSHLSSGVYLYRLTAGDQVQTRRMVYVR
jgi:endonuclease/exonuclease/phosphatase family metal-dependent hydrolase